MAQISNFIQVRADGKVVPAGMTVKEMLAKGWLPAKVVALRWSCREAPIQFMAPHGAHGILVPGGDFVAAIVDEDENGINSLLTILSADGFIYGQLQNRLVVSGSNVDGHFVWFEPAMAPGQDRFGAVFQTDIAGLYRCDIDARELSILDIARIH
jgi:hypothetical protein